ncbi:hypothetical protein LOAG_00500 [Loa loa]|uniref:C-type lectin domain-containing protein n=1 Tax=Loa loa TaxID=7209 RepID=A0A1S0UBQ0_LOALO|nr:hypothetical protein LOAG_00500 [Loa loa]EFO27992.2 hypothetical protein LOAG_00500 [Loa loa]
MASLWPCTLCRYNAIFVLYSLCAGLYPLRRSNFIYKISSLCLLDIVPIFFERSFNFGNPTDIKKFSFHDSCIFILRTFCTLQNLLRKLNFFTQRVGQKCQTSFVYRHDYCYLAGFTNFMPRFAIRTICNLMDSEIVKIKNKEEAHTVYGLAGGKSFWLGLRKGKRDWYWDTSTYGTRAHFFFWRTGQPDITDNKNCAYAAYAGEWMSADCDSFRSPKIFVCQSPSYKN